MTEELTDLVAHKAEGTMISVPVKDIMNNIHRPNAVFQWNEDKILGLQESMLSEGIWTNVEVVMDQWNAVNIAGGGHHRVEAVRRIISDGVPEKVRGLFLNDDEEWCMKVIKKKYTKDQMLKMFMLENADAWGKDNQQNICMMTVQVKDHLDRKLQQSATVEEFIAMVHSPYPLKMDERAYTRARNNGVGASTMVQFLGENTWSRQAIDFAIKVLYEPGKEGEKLKELAEKLPSVVMAYKFKRLMTQEQDGEKVLSSVDDQEKAEKLIQKASLSRNDLEKADKLKSEQDLSPLAALNIVVEQKKDEKTKAAGTTTPAPAKKKEKPAEAALVALKSSRGWVKMMIADEDHWSAAQFAQAKELFKDIAGDLKKLEKTAGKGDIKGDAKTNNKAKK